MSRNVAPLLILLGLLVALNSAVAAAATSSQQNLQAVAYEQRVGELLPGQLPFRNQRGEPVTLAALTADHPTVLVMSWYECPNLCFMLLDNLAATIQQLPFAAEDYQVIAVSIDPRETPAIAQKTLQRLARLHPVDFANWHLLTADAEAITALSEAVGFRYAYDAVRDSYAHPAGFVVISPGGVINRYVFSLEPSAPDLRLALLDAGQGKLGGVVDQLVLRCYRFDAESGRYNLVVMRLLQGAGLVFLLAMGLLFCWMRRRKDDDGK
ncbi:MAG: SCO family protein [Halopseudomonas sp.]|uniref:SCO family protein n=1 Tax=Halopseudomonas sp. TaxID=2901191 RepID=UPI003002AF7E